MKIPLFLKWLRYEIDQTSKPTKNFWVTTWWLLAILDMWSLYYCQTQWTRESGYGWTQGMYNLAMFFFWPFSLPAIMWGIWFVARMIIKLFRYYRASYRRYADEYKRYHD